MKDNTLEMRELENIVKMKRENPELYKSYMKDVEDVMTDFAIIMGRVLCKMQTSFEKEDIKKAKKLEIELDELRDY